MTPERIQAARHRLRLQRLAFGDLDRNAIDLEAALDEIERLTSELADCNVEIDRQTTRADLAETLVDGVVHLSPGRPGLPSVGVTVPPDPVPGAAPSAGPSTPASGPPVARPAAEVRGGSSAAPGTRVLAPPEDPPEVAIRRAREEGE